MARLSAEQMAAAELAAERGRLRWLQDHPRDHAGAARAAVDAKVTALLALHGHGRWV